MPKRPYSSRSRYLILFLLFLLPLLLLWQVTTSLVVKAQPLQQNGRGQLPLSDWPDLLIDGAAGTWGDLNNDGLLDLVVQRNGRIVLLFNQGIQQNGVPSFAEVLLSHDVRHFIHDLDLVDINRDGFLDISVTNGPDAYLIINPAMELGDPDQWQLETLHQESSNHTIDMAWGDFNGDGLLDLALANDQGFTDQEGAKNQLFLNESTTETIALTPILMDTFHRELPTVEAQWLDLNQDEQLDLVFLQGSRSSRVQSRTGQPVEQCINISQGGEPMFQCDLIGPGLDTIANDFAWADVDADAIPEMVLINEFGGLFIADYEDGELNLLTELEGERLSDVAWGDMDNDGDLDLVVARTLNQPTRIYVNDRGYFDPEGAHFYPDVYWETSDSTDTVYVQLADIDNDQDLDLTLTSYNSTRVYLNRGSMSRLPQQSLLYLEEPFPSAMSAAWGDVDNDGDLDLAVGNAVFCDFKQGLNVNQRYDPQTGQFRKFWCNSYAMGRQNPYVWWPYANTLYLNEDGVLQEDVRWQAVSATTTSVAWGDVNGDGLLDLVVGNRPNGGETEGGENEIYLHQPGTNSGLADEPILFGGGGEMTTKVALADSDGDGDLDIAVANANAPDLLYLNDGQGNFVVDKSWNPETAVSLDLAWGDLNNDGAPDLAVVQENGLVLLFLNEGPLGLSSQPVQVLQNGAVQSVAWGDMDGDGDQDLAVGGASNRVYANVNGRLHPTPIWQSADNSDQLTQVAWGDLNGDGYSDLIAATHDTSFSSRGKHNVIYFNQRGLLSRAPSWQSLAKTNSASVAVGDVDGDGLPDVAFGNGRMWPTQTGYGYGDVHHIQIYQNQIPATPLDAGHLTLNIAQEGAANFYAHPEIIATGQVAIPYTLSHPESVKVRSVWAEYSLNGGGQWFLALPTTETITQNLTADGSSYLFTWDIFASGLFGQSDNVVLRLHAIPDVTPAPNSFVDEYSVGAVSDQSAPMRVRGTQVQIFAESATPGNEVAHAVTYVLPEGNRKAQLVGRNAPFVTNAEGYLNGRGNLNKGDQLLAMLPVTQTYRVPPQLIFNGQSSYAQLLLNNPPTDTLSAEFWLFPTSPSGTLLSLGDEIEFRYETISDTTDLTLDLLGNTLHMPAVALRDGAAHHLAVTWQSEDGAAVVYLDGEAIGSEQLAQDGVLTAETLTLGAAYAGSLDEIRLWQTVRSAAEISQTMFTADPIFASSGIDLLTLFPEVRDDLIAYWPIAQLDEQVAHDVSGHQNDLVLRNDLYIGFKPLATIYHTSGAVTDTLGFDAVSEDGVQQLVVSAQNPLILYDIDVSLEWDARNDTLFLQQLEDSFQQASAILYDVTNGQLALGQVNLFHDKAYWGVADIMINADNSLRPSAAIGGVVNGATNDPDVPAGNGTSAYYPGQIRMGTSWDPYGENVADLGEEWTRALAHELAHYLLFLPDNYLGIDDQGIFRRVVCDDSFMTTTSDPSFSEFLTPQEWRGACLNTIAQKTTARSDWETIQTFYPMLKAPTSLNEGPANLPLDVTYLVPWAYAEEDIPYTVRNFDIRDVEKERLRLPSGQAYLIKTNDPNDVTDDVLIDLGSPTGGGDRIKVRGAEDGDRVCLFASFAEQAYSGCIANLNVNTVALTAAPIDAQYPSWNPQIRANSETAVSVQVNVEQELRPGEEMKVQIYPLHYGSVPGNAPVATMERDGNNHAQTLTMGMPAYDVAIRIWVEDDACQDGLLPNGSSCIREALTILRLNPEDWENPQTDYEASNDAKPLPVLSYVPFANPNTTAIGGPNTTAIGGPNTTAIGGPNTTAIGGPNTTAIGGPNTTAIGGPNTTAIGGAGRALLGNPNTTAIGGPNTTAIGGPNTTAIGGAIFLGNPNTTAIGGPNTTAIGGPNTTAIGGPNTTAIGGAGNILLGGPNTTAIGGAVFLGNPNTTAIGGPNTTAIGGGSKAASAPILSADSQLVIYDKQNFFAENGVKTVQTLFEVPQTASHPWLVPVGQAYRVELEDRDQERFISLNYLQRGVPEGYEHTLAAYFLPDGETAWQRIVESKSFVENLIVADLRSEDGVYAVMASIEMPTMKQGWNLFTYPLPVTRTITESLASIAGNYTAVYLPTVDVETAVITQATVTAHSLFIRPQPVVQNTTPNYLRRGERVTVIGQDPQTGAYQIQCPQFIDTGTDECWITDSANYVRVEETAVNIAPGLLPPTTLQTNVEQFSFGNAYWIWINADGADDATTIYLAPPRRAPNGELQ